jgi:hypothetical protein
MYDCYNRTVQKHFFGLVTRGVPGLSSLWQSTCRELSVKKTQVLWAPPDFHIVRLAMGPCGVQLGPGMAMIGPLVNPTNDDCEQSV